MTVRSKLFCWQHICLIASLSAIGAATISPFNFTIPTGFGFEYILRQFRFGSNLKDYWQNILLFIPLGISLTLTILERQLANRRNTVALVAVVCVLLSSAIETTQLLLPSRVSNLSDIICNGMGGIVGIVVYFGRGQIWRSLLGIIRYNRHRLNLKSLLWAIASYCAFVSLAIAILLANINLSNWNDGFYLTIGNETTGDRPWQGQISNLYISDRGLNQPEVEKVFQQPDTFFSQSPHLVTFLQFLDTKYDYLDFSQHIAPLLWYPEPHSLPPQTSTQQGILLDSKQWLQTPKSATSLNQKIAKSGEFSLYITIISNKIQQFGPARIVTLSDGIYGQNMMLGQQGKDLSLRLRTPITGGNATQPEFIVPSVFERPSVCHILVTFAHKKLNIYLNSDRTRYAFKFTPATSFLSYFPWQISNWIVNLAEFSVQKYQLTFTALIATPLSILSAILLRYIIFDANF